MEAEKPIATVLQQCVKYAKACNKSSVLHTKPVHVPSTEKLKYAFHYGADACYIGGKEFSLRANATNFSREEIKEAVELAKKFGSDDDPSYINGVLGSVAKSEDEQ